jgi:hypothetical protein
MIEDSGSSLSDLAASGANSDITSMTGLDDDGIPVAKVAGAAASGANSDITSMTGLDDDGIPVAKVDGAPAETAWTDYSATSTVTGWSAFTTKKIYYTKIGKLVLAAFSIIGTSNTTGASFTLPFTSANTTVGFIGSGGQIQDNGGAVDTTASLVMLPADSATVSIYRTLSGSNTFTASGTKQVNGTIVYESA